MSAILRPREIKTELKRVRDLEKESREALGRVLNSVNRLEESRKQILTMLPVLPDEEVIETRMNAQLAGRWAWVIECACDAEMFKREEAKRGRGHVDVDEKGRLATARKQAYLHGVGTSTLYRNAKIYNTFENLLIGENNLEEKGFFIAALAAPDPHLAIEEFSKKKANNAFFAVKEAWRDVKRAKKKLYEKKNELAYKANDETRKALRVLFNAVRLYLEQQRVVCAKLDSKLAGSTIGSWIQEIVDQEDVWFVLDAKDAAIIAWKNGNTREDHIATALGLPLPEIHRVMKELESDGIFERCRQRGTDQARGPGQQLWHLVGEPIPTYND
jgi:hypothetical protein